MFRTRWSFYLLYTIISSEISYSRFINTNSEDVESSNELIFCVKSIVEKYLTVNENVFIISAGDFDTGKLLREIEPKLSVNLVNKNNTFMDSGNFHNYIVFEDDFEDLRNPHEAVRNTFANPRGRYVVVTWKKERDLKISAAQFLRAKIPNVIFLKLSNDGRFKIFGYEIFASSVRLVLLDEWKKGFLNSTNLFPNKFKNMKGYPLRVAVVNTGQVVPDIYVTKVNGELTINGVGSSLLKLFVEKLNFRMVVLENFQYGIKMDNGSWTGPPGQLIRGDADLTFAGIVPSNIIINDLDYSQYYRWDGLYFAMKMGGRTVSWKSMFKPLSFTVWICYVITFLTTMGLVYVLKIFYFKKIAREYVQFTSIYKVLLSQSVSYPKRTEIRLGFSMWLIYGYLANTCYTGSLVDFLSMPSYVKNPNTLRELEESNMQFGGTFQIGRYFKATGDPIEQRIYDRFLNLTFTDFWELVKSEELAVSLVGTRGLLHNWQHRFNDSMQIHILQDPIIGLPFFYYMQKGHPHREPLNNFIRNVHSAGLLLKWMADYDVVHYTERKDERNSVVLTLHHLAGVFLILICGYLISVVTLFFEIYRG